MKYLLVADIAKKWNMSERSVRTVHVLPVRHGTFQKTHRNRSALTKEKKNRLLCWIF